MKVKNDSILPAPSEEMFEEFAEDYRVSLPEDYKLFLKKYNGAVPITNVFWHKDVDYVVEKFLCFLEEPDDYDVEGDYDVQVVMNQIDGRIMEDGDSKVWPIIPIAALFAGDFVCLDFRKNKNPAVIVWFHEESEFLSPVTTKVADNFTKFFGMLVEE